MLTALLASSSASMMSSRSHRLGSRAAIASRSARVLGSLMVIDAPPILPSCSITRNFPACKEISGRLSLPDRSSIHSGTQDKPIQNSGRKTAFSQSTILSRNDEDQYGSLQRCIMCYKAEDRSVSVKKPENWVLVVSPSRPRARSTVCVTLDLTD